MAASLFLHSAARAPDHHSYLVFRNSTFPASKSLSFQLNGSKKNLTLLALSQYSLLSVPKRVEPVCALDSDVPHPLHKGSVNTKSYEEWDSLTAKFAGAANIPFLLLQLPQIILNARNLLAGNKTALLAVPWLPNIRVKEQMSNLSGLLAFYDFINCSGGEMLNLLAFLLWKIYALAHGL